MRSYNHDALAQEFKHTIRVRYSDCDPQGVVFFANHLEYFDIAMSELWRESVGPYNDMVAEGVDMVVAEAGIRYRAPLPFDAEAEITASVTHLGTTSMSTALQISAEGVVRSEGELRHVFVATSGGKTEIPQRVRGALAAYLG